MRRTPDPALGLTSEEVLARAEYGLSNNVVRSAEKSTARIIFSNLFTYFNLLFFFLAFCLIAVGSGAQNLLFLGIVFCNTIITTVQELRAKKMLDRLTLVHAPHAKVIRDGREVQVLLEELVADDVILFSAGSQIPADALLLTGQLVTNEALVTGEADEITKNPGDALLSGSFVLSGAGRAQLTHVGKESFVSRLTLEAKRHKRVKTPGMMRSLSILVRIIGFLVLPLGGVLYWQQVARRGTDVLAAMQSSVSTIIGMIPEGLYLLASTALLLAVVRLAKKKVLAHNLSCVETLARVDVLCVDKTGTITEDVMRLTEILPAPACPHSKEDLRARLSEFCAASEPDNATILALMESFGKVAHRPVKDKIPFSSRRKFSGIDFGGGEAYVLGAPEVLLGKHFDTSALSDYLARGERVLLFASCSGFSDFNPAGKLLPLAFVLLENRVRESARETFSYFKKQGVAIKVISGDNPTSVSAVSLKAGIEGAQNYVDASCLTEEELKSAALTFTVFGRVSPEQKRTLILALKAAGHTVAMTGDGVNDVLALKEADCSVAMASGSEVAASVSQIVLLENDFSAMPSVVDEGRQVINNIQRSASLYLVKNIFSFFTALLLLILPLTYPIQPVQLSLISSLTIGIPSFFLALEPNHERVQGSFLKNVISRALPAGLTDFCLVSGIMLFALAFPTIPADVAATVVTLLLLFVGFLMLFSLCQPFNRWRTLLFVLLILAAVGMTLLLPGVLLLVSPGLAGWLLIAVFSVLAVVLFTFFLKSQKHLGALVEAIAARIQKK